MSGVSRGGLSGEVERVSGECVAVGELVGSVGEGREVCPSFEILDAPIPALVRRLAVV